MKKKYSGAANRELSAKAKASMTNEKTGDALPEEETRIEVEGNVVHGEGKGKTLEEAEKDFNKNLMGGRKGFEPDEVRAKGTGSGPSPKKQEQMVKDTVMFRDAKLINLSGKRMGRLYFPVDTIFNRPEDIIFILSMIGFLPFRAECLMHIGQFEYVGLCGQFDRIAEGAQAPIYEIKVEQNGKIINVNRAQNKTGQGVDLFVKGGN